MPPFNMHHREIDPPAELSDVIKCFWYTKRDRQDKLSSFEVVPDGYAEIIFYFNSLCSVSYNGNLQPLPSPFIVGLLNQPILFDATNQLEVIGVRCFPWTVFDLLGLPSSKEDVRIIKHPIAQLQSALAEQIQAGKIDEALDQVKQYFLHTKKGMDTDSTLIKAGVAMREANGSIAVSQVAAAAHSTVRTLERKFKQAAGHTVKDVSGLMRFEQVRNHLWTYPDASLAGLAHELGYTDQAHLSREFKRYSGTTPAAFAREAKKGKQTLLNDFVALIST